MTSWPGQPAPPKRRKEVERMVMSISAGKSNEEHAANVWTPFDYISKEFMRLVDEYKRNHLDSGNFDDFVKEKVSRKIELLDEPLLLPLFTHVCQLLVLQEQARLLDGTDQDQNRREPTLSQDTGGGFSK